MKEQTETSASEPAVMPLQDREAWLAELPLSAFVNTYYLWRDLQTCGQCRNVLVVGPGQGLTPVVLNWKGCAVTTLDIDETFKPDYLGSVHEMRMFRDQQFDAVIASHVIEHLAVKYLDASLKELARVARYALIYLPIPGRKLDFRFRTHGLRDLDLQMVCDLFNWFEKPEGSRPIYMQGQHFWEVGRRGFSQKAILKRMSAYFTPIAVYRNKEWPSSQNFVLKSKHGDA